MPLSKKIQSYLTIKKITSSLIKQVYILFIKNKSSIHILLTINLIFLITLQEENMKNQAAHLQIQVYQKNKNSSQILSKQQTLDQKNLKPQILILIKEVTASSLRIQDTPRPSIVKQISQIIFSKLIDLNLRNSQITNIQFIQYLQCPVLLTLELYGNYISNLKSLSKNQTLPKIRLVTVYRNPLKQNWPLNRQFMAQHREFQLDNGSRITIEDISFLAKNPGRKITKIYMNGKDRIKQKKVKKVFSQLKKFDNS